jgi:hypothetical protein
MRLAFKFTQPITTEQYKDYINKGVLPKINYTTQGKDTCFGATSKILKAVATEKAKYYKVDEIYPEKMDAEAVRKRLDDAICVQITGFNIAGKGTVYTKSFHSILIWWKDKAKDEIVIIDPDPTTDEMESVRAKAEELGKEIWLFPAGKIGGDELNSKFVRITTVEELMKEYKEYVVVTDTNGGTEIDKPFQVMIAAKKLPDSVQIEPGCRIF